MMEEAVRELRNLSEYMLVAVFFLISTVLSFFPSSFSPLGIPMGGGGDSRVFMWNMWWVEKALSQSLPLFKTAYLFYPRGADLGLHTLSLVNSLLSIPIYSITNYVFAYNTLIVFSFVGTGVATYLLAGEFVDDRRIAGVAALAVTFSPYRMGHSIGHLNLVSTQWLVLFVFLVIRSFRADKRFYPVLAGLVYVVNLFSSYIYAVHGAIFLLVYAGYRTVKATELSRPEIYRQLVLIGVAPILAMPLFEPVLSSALESPAFRTLNSASLELYLVPHNLLSFYSAVVPASLLNSLSNYAEESIFLGYTFLAVSLAGARRGFRDRYFWIAGAIFFLLLSLGTGIFDALPVAGVMRNPARYGFMVLLLLSVPFAVGLQEIVRRLGENRGAAAIAAIAALIMLEFLWIPHPHLYFDYGEQSENALESIESEEAVINLPYQRLFSHVYMYQQTMHGKKIVGGKLSRGFDPPDFLSSRYLEKLDSKPLESGNFSSGWMQGFSNLLRSNGVDRVILHKRFLKDPELEPWRRGFRVERETDYLMVLEVPGSKA